MIRLFIIRSNEKCDKEKFLENIEDNNNKEIINHLKNLDIIYSKVESQKYGMIIAAVSVFFGSCGIIYTKTIQKTYPEDFKTVQFLFLRSFTLFFLH
jgi:hypothetical protein